MIGKLWTSYGKPLFLSANGKHLKYSDKFRYLPSNHEFSNSTVLVLSNMKKLNATASQPNRNVLKYFAMFKNVAHSSGPGETPSDSAFHQAQNYARRS